MKYTNDHGLPAILARALERNDHRQEGKYSVSEIINPPQVSVLKKRHDKGIVKDVSSNLWALLGTAVHGIIEKNGSSSDLVEQHLMIEIDGITLSGTPDHFNLETLALNDWKCTSTWTYIYGGREEWEQALNVYAFMINSKLGKYPKTLTNHMVLRDHMKSKAKYDRTYPQVPFVSMQQELWTPGQTEQFIIDRIQLHEDAAKLDDANLPECTSDERWCKADTWRVKKNGGKKAISGGVFEKDEQGAKDKLDAVGTTTHFIDFQRGEAIRCADYCDPNQFCTQYATVLKEANTNAGCK